MAPLIAILGFGSIGQRYLRLVKELFPESTVLVQSSRNILDVASVDIYSSSISQTLSYAPDYAIIASPAKYHLQYYIALRDVCTRILIEKPLCVDLSELSDLPAFTPAIDDSIVGYNLRFLPSLYLFRNLIRSKTYGDPLFIHSSVSQHIKTWRPGRKLLSTVSLQRELGGGVIRELSHELDYLLWIFGLPSHVTARLYSPVDFLTVHPVDQIANINLEFTSSTYSFSADLSLNFISHQQSRTLTVGFQDSTLSLDFHSGIISLSTKNSPYTPLYVNYPSRDYTYNCQLQSLILNQPFRAAPCTLSEAILVQELISTIELSDSTQSLQAFSPHAY